MELYFILKHNMFKFKTINTLNIFNIFNKKSIAISSLLLYQAFSYFLFNYMQLGTGIAFLYKQILRKQNIVIKIKK